MVAQAHDAPFDRRRPSEPKPRLFAHVRIAIIRRDRPRHLCELKRKARISTAKVEHVRRPLRHDPVAYPRKQDFVPIIAAVHIAECVHTPKMKLLPDVASLRVNQRFLAGSLTMRQHATLDFERRPEMTHRHMKVLSRLVLVSLIVGAGVFVWRKYQPAPQPEVSIAKPEPVAPIPPPDLSSRSWTDTNGRSFLGELVSVNKDHVVLRRSADKTHFQISAATLSVEDQQFLQEQIRRAKESGQGFPDEVPGLYTVRRKLDIKGNIMRVPASELVGGWRNERAEPMFMFLLSSKLHESEDGCAWVRVEEKTFRQHNEGAYVTDSQLGANALTERLPWARPRTTLREANYGPHGQGMNVTHALMRIASQGGLPAKLSPELLKLPAHAPATWELHVSWRTPEGETRRILKDGDSVNWP